MDCIRSTGIYVASKACHAPMWRQLRDHQGFPIVSSWVDLNPGTVEAMDAEGLRKMAETCMAEIRQSTLLLLLSCPGEWQNGSLMEAGAALMHGIPVWSAGPPSAYKAVFLEHPLWQAFPDLDHVLASLGCLKVNNQWMWPVPFAMGTSEWT